MITNYQKKIIQKLVIFLLALLIIIVIICANKTPSKDIENKSKVNQSTNETKSFDFSVYQTANGLLQVYRNGELGTVCEDEFDKKDAEVVCRMLGKSYRSVQILHNFSGHGVVALSGIDCEGTELSLKHCKMKAWGDNQCDHSQDVGVACENDIIKVRQTENGLLLANRNGVEGTVCGDMFDEKDARVICRIMGEPFRSVRILSKVPDSRETGLVALSEMDCEGSEHSLNECPMKIFDHKQCNSKNAGVVCENDIISVSLETNGTLYVTKNGQNGTVCNDEFDENDARVVCRMLGQDTNSPEIYTNIPGKGMIALEDIGCDGNESFLNECRLKPWGQHHCSHDEDVRIVCEEKMTAYLDSHGVVYVRKNGISGTVCDDGFDINEAKVVCRMLNLPSYNPTVKTGISGSRTGLIALDDVRCSGSEASLSECSSTGWGKHDCRHSEDVGVNCN